MLRRLLLIAACTACLLSGSIASASAAPATFPVAVVGAESALGYATAIVLGKHNALAVHSTHGLTSLQLVRILHLRELGIVTLAVDFADLSHVYRFNSSVSASQIALFADVGDEQTFEYLLAMRHALQEIEDMREGGRRMAVKCFATDMRLAWLGDGYCKDAPLVESALPPAPRLACQASGMCETLSLGAWGGHLAKLFGITVPVAAPPHQLPASLQEMLRRFPNGCDTDASKCEPLVMEYMRTDYAEVGFTGSMSMQRRHKYSRPSAGFFEFPCGMLGPTPFDLDDVGWADLTSHCETVVITAIFGGTDLLITPFAGSAAHSTCYFAFLDATSAEAHQDAQQLTFQQYSDTMWVGKHGVWTLVVLRPVGWLLFPFANPRRTSRIPKMLSHRLFPNAKYTLWIDGNKNGRGRTVEQFLDGVLQRGRYVSAFGSHSAKGRSSAGESVTTMRLDLEHPQTIQVQDTVYGLDYKDYATDRIVWAGTFVRDNQKLSVHWQSCLWFNDWARYSQRDQVSLVQTLKWSGLQSTTQIFPKEWVGKIHHKKRHGA